MDIREVTPANQHVYLNLCQSYEGEFSAITAKLPDADGRFALDTEIGGAVQGFLLHVGRSPVGFAAIKIELDLREVCEFYIVPSMRGRGLGKAFAQRLFARFPGKWQVKQLEAASYATRFWTKVIAEFSRGDFTHDLYDDAYWGRVARQCFESTSTCVAMEEMGGARDSGAG